MSAQKQQFVVVDNDKTIQAVVMVRGDEFYVFERLEDAPKNFAELQREYPAGQLIPVELRVEEPSKLSN